MAPEDLIEEMRLNDLDQEARKETLAWALNLVDENHPGSLRLTGPERTGAALPIAEWLMAGSQAAAGAQIPKRLIHPNHLAFAEILEIEKEGAAADDVAKVEQLYAGLNRDADDGGSAAREFERRTGEPFADFVDAGGTVAHAFEIMEGSYDADADADEVYVGGRRADGTPPEERLLKAATIVEE